MIAGGKEGIQFPDPLPANIITIGHQNPIAIHLTSSRAATRRAGMRWQEMERRDERERGGEGGGGQRTVRKREEAGRGWREEGDGGSARMLCDARGSSSLEKEQWPVLE